MPKKTKTKKGAGKSILVRLVSTKKTGHFYTTCVRRIKTKDIQLKKYDPTIRMRVTYKTSKI